VAMPALLSDGLALTVARCLALGRLCLALSLAVAPRLSYAQPLLPPLALSLQPTPAVPLALVPAPVVQVL